MTRKSDTKPRSCINTQKNMKTASFMMQAAREKEMFFKIHSLLYLNVLHQENLKPYMGLFNVDNLLMAPIPSFGYNPLAIMNSCRCCSLDDKQMNKKGFFLVAFLFILKKLYKSCFLHDCKNLITSKNFLTQNLIPYIPYSYSSKTFSLIVLVAINVCILDLLPPAVLKSASPSPVN